MSAERQSKGRIKDPRIHKPTLVPTLCTNVIEAFWSLNRSRQGTGFGPAPIPLSELLAWSTLMNEKLDRWEVSLFGRLDSAYLEEVSKKMEEQDG